MKKTIFGVIFVSGLFASCGGGKESNEKEMVDKEAIIEMEKTTQEVHEGTKQMEQKVDELSQEIDELLNDI